MPELTSEKNRRILIIDDNLGSLELLSEALAQPDALDLLVLDHVQLAAEHPAPGHEHRLAGPAGQHFGQLGRKMRA